jgi:hypothetical protein
MTVRPLCGFCGYTLEQCQCKNEREKMNNKATHELMEIAEQLEEFLAVHGHDETPPEVHAEIRHGGAMYNTRKLADTFLQLERDGYSALGFSLVVDLINRDCVEGGN